VDTPTEFYQTLRKAVRQAEALLWGVPEHGSITKLHHIRVQSFVLMTHAAIEQYLEELGEAAALKARKRYKEKGHISKTLLALITSNSIKRNIEGISYVENLSDISVGIEESSKNACTAYVMLCKKNNGIKSKDQKALLLPVGVDPSQVDPVVFNGLNTLGTHRGDIAHKFMVIRSEHTANSIRGELRTLTEGLIGYDQAVCEALGIGMGTTEFA